VVKIRLKKFGSKKRPYYRIVVQDSREPRDGRTIEELGVYHPIEVEEKQISFLCRKSSLLGWCWSTNDKHSKENLQQRKPYFLILGEMGSGKRPD